MRHVIICQMTHPQKATSQRTALGEESVVRAQVKQLYDGMVSEYKSMLERQLSAVFLAGAAAPQQNLQAQQPPPQEESAMDKPQA